jgi:hypothetical protein
MCIKYEASGGNERPNLPSELEEARKIAKDTYRKARASKEELEQQMSVLSPTKSPG